MESELLNRFFTFLATVSSIRHPAGKQAHWFTKHYTMHSINSPLKSQLSKEMNKPHLELGFATIPTYQ